MLGFMTLEVNNFERSRNHLQIRINDLMSMHRQKRSLIPIIGKALEFLFGTSNESDLGSIKSNLVRLATFLVRLRHIVE